MTVFQGAEAAAIAGVKGAAAGMALGPIGAGVGGLIGIASALVPMIFGEESKPLLQAAAAAITGQETEEAQATALATDPAMAETYRLKLIEIAQQINVEKERTRQVELQQLTEQVRIAAADTANARAMNIDLAKGGSPFVWQGIIIDVFVLTLFGFCVVMTFTVGLPNYGMARDITLSLLGILGTLTVTVVSYWRGSSAGSARKSEWLNNSVPSHLLPQPATIVPSADVPTTPREEEGAR